MGRHTAETPQPEQSEFVIPQLAPDDAPGYVSEVVPAPEAIEAIEQGKPTELTRAQPFAIPELAPIDDTAIAPEVGGTNTAGALGFATRSREERRRVAPVRTPLERKTRRNTFKDFMPLSDEAREAAETEVNEERQRIVTARHLAQRAIEQLHPER